MITIHDEIVNILMKWRRDLFLHELDGTQVDDANKVASRIEELTQELFKWWEGGVS